MLKICIQIIYDKTPLLSFFKFASTFKIEKGVGKYKLFNFAFVPTLSCGFEA